jgi:predicted glycoside hydrolase/deacetylase ChbG (UPF0249 family)
MQRLFLCFLVCAVPLGFVHSQGISVLVRCDDIGMCHTVNQAVIQVIEAGIPFSVSVMFACPWYQEAVDILRQHPEVSVGIHLTLNAEWREYRWGPVAGAEAVPSLVDSCGYFFPSRALLFRHTPNVVEVEKELRAQIHRALQSGLHIDYVDYHMSAAVSTPELRALVERLAAEFGLAISRYFGEEDVEGYYGAQPADKAGLLLGLASHIATGAPQLFVFHIGLQTTEMDALTDQNSVGLEHMSRHREAELHALLSPGFIGALKGQGAELITYRTLIARNGLNSMHRP